MIKYLYYEYIESNGLIKSRVVNVLCLTNMIFFLHY